MLNRWCTTQWSTSYVIYLSINLSIFISRFSVSYPYPAMSWKSEYNYRILSITLSSDKNKFHPDKQLFFKKFTDNNIIGNYKTTFQPIKTKNKEKPLVEAAWAGPIASERLCLKSEAQWQYTPVTCINK